MTFAIRLLLCIACFAFCLYIAIHRQNAITALRLEVPELERELERQRAETVHLQFAVEQLADPARLLAQLPDYPHLIFPTEQEVIVAQRP